MLKPPRLVVARVRFRPHAHRHMNLQLSTTDIEPEAVTEAELQGIAELRARILTAQGRDAPLPEQVCTHGSVEPHTEPGSLHRAHAERLSL